MPKRVAKTPSEGWKRRWASQQQTLCLWTSRIVVQSSGAADTRPVAQIQLPQPQLQQLGDLQPPQQEEEPTIKLKINATHWITTWTLDNLQNKYSLSIYLFQVTNPNNIIDNRLWTSAHLQPNFCATVIAGGGNNDYDDSSSSSSRLYKPRSVIGNPPTSKPLNG
eukprot:scaffold9020_cov47-Cyclotella_meneghiniana.AAC.2